MSGGRSLDQWARIVDAIAHGERLARPVVTLGRTPDLLQGLGLATADLTMTVGKIARCHREHPDVPRRVWHDLPTLISRPLAVVPSARGDGSLVLLLVVTDISGRPVIVPIIPGSDGAPNVVLSVYGKDNGHEWIRRELGYAIQEGLPHYVSKGFAAALPQPGSAKAIPSSSGLIPADGTAKPNREILSLSPKVKDSG